jgi:hypothetical protein
MQFSNGALRLQLQTDQESEILFGTVPAYGDSLDGRSKDSSLRSAHFWDVHQAIMVE